MAVCYTFLMPLSNDMLVKIAIFILGVGGFLVATHIRKHKTQNTPLVCPIGFDCHAVVHSDYSRFFGIPVEVFGMIYYSLISVAYLYLIFVNQVPVFVISALIFLSLLAFLFSAYLIAVQIFILKKGCSWCIVSALVTLCIFILTIWK